MSQIPCCAARAPLAKASTNYPGVIGKIQWADPKNKTMIDLFRALVRKVFAARESKIGVRHANENVRL